MLLDLLSFGAVKFVGDIKGVVDGDSDRNIKSDIISSPTNSNSIITTSIHNIKSIPLPVSIKSMDNESLATDMESMYDNKSVTSTKTDKMMNGEYNENSSDDGIEMIADPKTPNNEQINLF